MTISLATLSISSGFANNDCSWLQQLLNSTNNSSQQNFTAAITTTLRKIQKGCQICALTQNNNKQRINKNRIKQNGNQNGVNNANVSTTLPPKHSWFSLRRRPFKVDFINVKIEDVHFTMGYAQEVGQ